VERAFGAYRLGEPLGTLPFGELVAATHPARSEPLAVLLLDSRLSSDHRFRGLVRLELARVGGLRQPGVARTIEVSEQSGALAVVYERPPEGVSLAERLTSPGRPDQAAALRMVRRLAEALDAAHSRRIVHGLFGPAAVLISAELTPVIVGVGLLAAVEEAGWRDAILADADPDFLAPEQRVAPGDPRNGAAVASADGYALAVLAERLLGEQADRAGSVLARQQSADPKQRFSNCTAFADALGEQVSPSSSIAAPATPPVPAPTTLPSEVPPERPPQPGTPGRPHSPAGGREAAPTAPLPEVAPSAGSSPLHGGRIPVGAPQSTRLRPTSAMLICQQQTERADILTSGVMAIADRVEMLDWLIDRYAPEGRVGPVPLGAAVAGILCLLLLLLRQPAAAAIFVVLVLGVYVLPPLLKKITANEQPPLEAIRATGPASVRVRQIAPQWDSYELEIRDDAPLALTPSGYRRLAALGHPVVVERQGPHGPESHTVAHDFPSLTVTYLLPGRLLLDVRDAAGSVVYRHPKYAGEPGDRDSLATPTGADRAQGADVARTGRRALAEQPDATPTWKPTAYGHRLVQRMPPQLTAELRAAFKSAATKAGLANGVPAAVLLVSLFTGDFGFFALFFAIGIFGFVGAGLLVRAMNLWHAQHSDAIVRVASQVRVQQIERTGSKGKKSQHFHLRLDDGKELKIEQGLFDRLAALGRPMELGDGPSFWERLTQNEEVRRVYEVDGLTVTYEPTSDLLLDVIDGDGTTVYRDSAVSLQALGMPPARAAPSPP
jgi:serine/threonine protein kinase